MSNDDSRKTLVYLKDNNKHANTDESDSGYARALVDEGAKKVVPPPQKIWFEIRNSPAVFLDTETNKTYRTTDQNTGFTDLVYFHSSEKGSGDLYAYWDVDHGATGDVAFNFIAKGAPPPPPPPPPPPRVKSVELTVVLDFVPIPVVQATVITENGDPPDGLPVHFSVQPLVLGDGKDVVDINPNPAITELVSEKGVTPDPVPTVKGVSTAFVTVDQSGEIAAQVYAWVGPDETNTQQVNANSVWVNFFL